MSDDEDDATEFDPFLAQFEILAAATELLLAQQTAEHLRCLDEAIDAQARRGRDGLGALLRHRPGQRPTTTLQTHRDIAIAAMHPGEGHRDEDSQ